MTLSEEKKKKSKENSRNKTGGELRQEPSLAWISMTELMGWDAQNISSREEVTPHGCNALLFLTNKERLAVMEEMATCHGTKHD